MKHGVETSPWGVFKIPALALVPGSVARILNFKELFLSVTIALTN
jgi:hypothetical protein